MSPLFLCPKRGIIKKNGSRFSDPAAVLEDFIKNLRFFRSDFRFDRFRYYYKVTLL